MCEAELLLDRTPYRLGHGTAADELTRRQRQQRITAPRNSQDRGRAMTAYANRDSNFHSRGESIIAKR